MTAYYIDKKNPALGCYRFAWHTKSGLWRWTWTEGSDGNEITEDSDWFQTLPLAMRSAADDWETHGDGSNPRFAGMLRGLAKRAEKEDGNERTV